MFKILIKSHILIIGLILIICPHHQLNIHHKIITPMNIEIRILTINHLGTVQPQEITHQIKIPIQIKILTPTTPILTLVAQASTSISPCTCAHPLNITPWDLTTYHHKDILPYPWSITLMIINHIHIDQEIQTKKDSTKAVKDNPTTRLIKVWNRVRMIAYPPIQEGHHHQAKDNIQANHHPTTTPDTLNTPKVITTISPLPTKKIHDIVHHHYIRS